MGESAWGAASELVERAGELDALRDGISAASAGDGQVIMIEGAAGIGKTRLLASAAAIARDEGSSSVRPRRSARAGLRFRRRQTALRTAPRPVGGAGPCEALAGAAGPTESLLVGERPATGGDPFGLLHGLYWLSANLAEETPLLLSIDDAQWSDAPSLRWLFHLARRVDELPIVLIVAVRPRSGGAADELIEAIHALPSTETLSLGPLTADGIGALLEVALGAGPDAELVGVCAEVSGGNPFLLKELAQSMAADGLSSPGEAAARARDVRPETVSRAVLLRLARLTPEAQEIARAVAILGSEVAVRHAAELAGCDEPTAGEAADVLAAAGMLDAGRPLSFSHSLMRDVVHSDLAEADRAARHKRAARLLAADGAPAEQVAAHLHLTEPAGDQWVVAALGEAADEAASRSAPDIAANYLARAAAEPPSIESRPRLLLELGRLESIAARFEAAEHLTEAYRLSTDLETRIAAAEAATPFLLASGRKLEAVEMLEPVLGELSVHDPERASQLEAQFVGASMLDPDSVALADERFGKLDPAPDRASVGAQMMLCHLAYRRMWRAEDAALAAATAEAALGDGRLLAERGVLPPELTGPLVTLVCADRLSIAGEQVAVVSDAARASGAGHAIAFAGTMAGSLALRRGALPDAEAEARAALDITIKSGFLLADAVNAAFLIPALIERGGLDEAEMVVDEIGLAGEVPRMTPFLMFLSVRGRLRLAQGRSEDGLADLLECGRRCVAFELRNSIFVPWRASAAVAHRAAGDLGAARALVEEELDAARAWGTPGWIGAAEALAATFSDDRSEAIERLRGAVGLLEDSPARLEHARALVELGAALRRDNKRAEARQPLRDGMRIAQVCGSEVLVDRAAEELRATGAKPRRAVLAGVDSLTASELRVARMATQGLTNREIAQALYVTSRTVETHLRHCYQKLEIDGRGELAPALE